MMSPSIQMNWHPTDDQLEMYSLQRLESPETVQVEQHLLLCERCMLRQQQADEYVLLLQGALQVRASRLLPASVGQNRWGWGVQPGPRWAMALGTAVVAIGILSTLPFMQEANSSAVTVTLVATRAATDPAFTVPAGHPLDLRLQTEGLAGRAFHTEVVNELGRSVWTGTAVAAQQPARVLIDRQLAAGHYWVRLYETEGGDLLREYALPLKP